MLNFYQAHQNGEQVALETHTALGLIEEQFCHWLTKAYSTVPYFEAQARAIVAR